MSVACQDVHSLQLGHNFHVIWSYVAQLVYVSALGKIEWKRSKPVACVLCCDKTLRTQDTSDTTFRH